VDDVVTTPPEDVVELLTIGSVTVEGPFVEGITGEEVVLVELVKMSVTVDRVLLLERVDTTSEEVIGVAVAEDEIMGDVTVLLVGVSVGNRVGRSTDRDTEIEINGVDDDCVLVLSGIVEDDDDTIPDVKELLDASADVPVTKVVKAEVGSPWLDVVVGNPEEDDEVTTVELVLLVTGEDGTFVLPLDCTTEEEVDVVLPLDCTTEEEVDVVLSLDCTTEEEVDVVLSLDCTTEEEVDVVLPLDCTTEEEVDVVLPLDCTTEEELDVVPEPPFDVVVLLSTPLVVREVTVWKVLLLVVGNRVGKSTDTDTEIEINGEEEALVDEVTKSDVPDEETCPLVVDPTPEVDVVDD